MDARHLFMEMVSVPSQNDSRVGERSALVELTDVVKTSVPVKAWTAAPRYEARVASCLTDFLDVNRPAIKALFPAATRVVTCINKASRDSGIYIPPSDSTRKLNWYSRVGLAVERALVHLLGGDLLGKPRAALKSSRSGDWKWLWKALEVQFEQCERGSLDVQDRATIGLLLVVGALEPIMRGVVSPSDINLAELPSRKCSAEEIARWFAEQTPPEVAEEIALILAAAVRAVPAGPYFINPVYGGYGAIMGSDGDFVAGTTLVEMKCISTNVLGMHIAQLLGYGAIRALAKKSAGKRMGPPLERYAIFLPRRAWCVTGTTAEWLECLEGPSAKEFAQSFAHYCKDC